MKKSDIIQLIEDNIEFKTPLILPAEHAAVEKKIVDAAFMLYEVKQLDIPLAVFDDYITNNYDGTGLGIGESDGFARCNGNNGTVNRNGRVSIGYDPVNYATIGSSSGAKEITLEAKNIPQLDITVKVTNAGGGGSPFSKIVASGSGTEDDKTYTDAVGFADNTAISIMQPYIVTLFIQRIA